MTVADKVIRPTGPLFKRHRNAVAAGLVLWGLAVICLADAYRGGRRPPFPIRLIMPPS